jgi:branched-chain amino acid transport system permease protein
MTSEIFVLLGQDGVTNGAIYALLALSLVLVYSVTRIVFVPQGEFVTYGAMTLASIQFGGIPGTLWILCGLSAVVAVLELVSMLRLRRFAGLPATLALYLLTPAVLAAVCWLAPLKGLPLAIQALLTVALVVPIGPLIYRVFFQPLASASILVLLIAAVAVHLAMVGLGLLAFGAEGMRTASFASGRLDARKGAQGDCCQSGGRADRRHSDEVVRNDMSWPCGDDRRAVGNPRLADHDRLL